MVAQRHHKDCTSFLYRTWRMAEQGLHQLCVENGEWLQKDCKSFFNECGLSGLSELWVFLCTFMKVYGTFGWFCFVAVTFDVFVDRLSHFFDPIWGYIGHFSEQNRVIFWSNRGQFGVTRDHFGIVLTSFWVVSMWFWPHSETFWAFLSSFSPMFGPF